MLAIRSAAEATESVSLQAVVTPLDGTPAGVNGSDVIPVIG